GKCRSPVAAIRTVSFVTVMASDSPPLRILARRHREHGAPRHFHFGQNFGQKGLGAKGSYPDIKQGRCHIDEHETTLFINPRAPATDSCLCGTAGVPFPPRKKDRATFLPVLGADKLSRVIRSGVSRTQQPKRSISRT